MSESSLLDDMNDFFDEKNVERNENNGMTVVNRAQGGSNANVEIFYRKLEGLGINLTELQPLLNCQSNLLVQSSAGSGKTTALILKIIHDLLAGHMMRSVPTQSAHGNTIVNVPAKILVSTFLRSGAAELQVELRNWCQRLGIVGVDYSNIQFSTIHAEVKKAIEAMGVPVNVLEDTSSLVRTVMNKYGIRSVTATARSITIDELNDVQGIVAFARNRLDQERYNHPLLQDYRMDQILLDAVLADLKLYRAATGKMDFEDMQEMLLDALKTNQNVRQFIGNRYDFIFVDEFQDTSQLQYELLKYYFSGAKRVVVVGDSDQCIYDWRGSDNGIIETKFEQDWHPEILSLSTNYRCKSNILNPVISSIEKNSNRHDKKLLSYKEGGEVSVVTNGTVSQLIEGIRSDLTNNMKVGVLARTNADLLIPAMILEVDGNIEYGLSKSVSMTSSLPRRVYGIIDLVIKRFTPEFESYFRVFLPRRYWYEAEKLFNILSANKSMNIYNIPSPDLQYSVPTLSSFILGLRSAKEIGDVEAYLYILEFMEQSVYTGTSLYAQKARDLINFTKKMILEHEKLKDKSIYEIDNLFNSILPDRLANRIRLAKDMFIKLTTVHEAKGKEWDSVYIWNDVDGAFPNSVGNRDLTPAEFEEERRVHYIAWTRAKSKLTVFTDANEEKMGQFLKECDLSLATVVDNEPMKDMSTLFKKKNFTVDSEGEFERILRKYITDTLANRSITDQRVANLEIVQDSFAFTDIVKKIDEQLDISTISYEDTLILDNFFADLADEIVNYGQFNH